MITAVPATNQPTAQDAAALARRARGGDRPAFEALYRSHVGRVYALCLRMSGDRVGAEELCQGAFVRAWEKLDGFRGDAAFSTWLHRLTVNHVLSDRRSGLRRLARVVPVEDPEATSPGRPPTAGAGLDLERAIATLPTGARVVFVLHDVEGYAHPEVARLLGVTTGTSKAQLSRARRLLREALS
jgi:RNA polymerase sigma-70 factor, ECF subfamily